MSWLGRWRTWLRGALRGRRMEREMREELEAHIAQASERYAVRGMSRDEALRAARREFGHLGTAEQAGRDVRGGQWLSGVLGDVRYALRWYARTPLTSITIVLTLTLGIGFSSGVFSVIDGVLRRPAPGVPNDPDLVKIRGLTDRSPFRRGVSYPELEAYSALPDLFAGVAGWVSSSAVLEAGGDDAIERVATQFVTPNYFALLGVGMAQGRGFAAPVPGDAADLSAVISDALAEQRFGGAREAIGRRISVNGVSVTVAGVTAKRFHGALSSGRFRMIWLPLSAWHAVDQVDRAALGDVTAARFEAFGRLRPGLEAAGATPAVRVVAARYDAESRARGSRAWTGTADVVRLRGNELNASYDEDLPAGAMIASTIALLILLVCTTTVNSLLVGAAAMRRHEIGVRLSLGASRGRVVRQLLTEVAILALLGGVLGLWALGLLARVTEVAAEGFDVSPNWLTTAFVLLYALATAALSGLSPALHATRTGVANVLKDSGGGASRKSRLQRAFVVAQIAVAQPLMVALGVAMFESAANVTPAGGNALRERLVTLQLDTWISAVRREADPVPGLVRRLAGLPGVEAVVPMGFAIGPVMIDRPETTPSTSSTRSTHSISAMQQFIEPGYFAAVNAPLLMGRSFVPSDTLLDVSPVILGQALADSLFPSGSAVGRRIRKQVGQSDERVVLEVVGVVGVARDNEPYQFNVAWPSMYLPLRRSGGEAILLIRTSGPGEAIMPAVLEAVRAEARLAPVTQLTTAAMSDREERREDIQLAGALSGMGALVLLLASVGLYAMVRMAVEQRRREIGIRIALGADARRVVRMFFGGGMRTTLLGLALGLPPSVVALALMFSKQTFVSNVTIAGAAVTVVVIGVAALASWLPARRAARVDAMVALRSE